MQAVQSQSSQSSQAERSQVEQSQPAPLSRATVAEHADLMVEEQIRLICGTKPVQIDIRQQLRTSKCPKCGSVSVFFAAGPVHDENGLCLRCKYFAPAEARLGVHCTGVSRKSLAAQVEGARATESQRIAA